MLINAPPAGCGKAFRRDGYRVFRDKPEGKFSWVRFSRCGLYAREFLRVSPRRGFLFLPDALEAETVSAGILRCTDPDACADDASMGNPLLPKHGGDTAGSLRNVPLGHHWTEVRANAQKRSIRTIVR